MSWLAEIRTRVFALFRSAAMDRERDEEMRFHVEESTRRNIERGMAQEQARRRALMAFGGIEFTKEVCRDERGTRLFEDLARDLRYGMKQMRRNPIFTACAVLILSLGIGANTALFSILETVFFRPLRYPDSSRLVLLGEAYPGQVQKGPVGGTSYENFIDWNRQNEVFEHLAAFKSDEFNVAGGDEVHRIPGERVSASFFNLLGIQAHLGRTLTVVDFAPDGNPVAVLSHRYWQTAFGGRPDIVGRIIRIDGQPTVVVGVMPERFRSSAAEGGARLWIPLIPAIESTGRSYNIYTIIGRLKRGVTLERARTDMTQIERRLEERYPDDFAARFHSSAIRKGWSVRIEGMHQLFVQRGMNKGAKLLATLFGLFLLLVCVNIANLLLAMGADRKKEIGVRIALGAGRSRVIRQLMVESLLLAFMGGAGGILIAAATLPPLLHAGNNPFAVLGILHFEIDGRVFLFTFLISLVSCVVFGLLPAVTSSQVKPFETIKSISFGHTGDKRRLARILVAMELAISLLLLVGGSFVFMSLYQLWSYDWGFPLQNKLVVSLALSPNSYSEAVSRKRFFEDLLVQAETLPGVRSAALSMNPAILMRGALTQIRIETEKGNEDYGRIRGWCDPVSPGYFETLGISLRKGRFFTDLDKSWDVAIVNESMVRALWKGRDPIGERVGVFNRWYTVIGVCADVRMSFISNAEYMIYVPDSMNSKEASLFLYTSGDPMALAKPIRDIIRRMDPDQPVKAVSTLEQARAALGDPWEFLLAMIGSIAVAAVAVSAIGVYGVTSRTVRARTREIGIRMALGATGGSAVTEAVKSGARSALFGVALGSGVALLASRLLVSEFPWLESIQSWLIVQVTLLLGAIALLACYAAARRAARTDIIEVLRAE